MTHPTPDDIAAAVKELTGIVDDLRLYARETEAGPVIRGRANFQAASLSRVADMLAAMGWQGIETAPKDGKAVLLVSGNWQTVGMWYVHRACWVSNGPSYTSYSPDEQPTHWMPSPNRQRRGTTMDDDNKITAEAA